MQISKLVLKESPEAVEERLVYGEVYAPNRGDADKEFMDSATIKKMAHDFIRNLLANNVDVQHDNKTMGGVSVVESFIARKGDPDFIEDSWVVGVNIDNDQIWAKVKKGEINGFSLEGLVNYEDVEVELEIPDVTSGTTSKSEGHQHKFYVKYSADGTFIGGETDLVEGHKHPIRRGTLTEKVAGHAHTFCSVDEVQVIATA